MKTMVMRLAASFLAAILMLCASVPAFSHAQLLTTEPTANAVLQSEPQSVRLVFNEPVTPLAIALVSANGASRDLLDQTVGGENLMVTLPPEIGEGTHVLSWRVVSVDSHPVAGSLVFSVGEASGTADLPAVETTRETALALWLSKTLVFAALFIGTGGAIFSLAAPLSGPSWRIALSMSALGLALAPLSLGLHGADAMGLAPGSLLTETAWATGFATTYGTTMLLLLATFGLSMLVLLLPALTWIAWPAWALAAVSLAISGHAGAADPQWLTRVAVALHIGGILFWVGALVPLWYWLRESNDAANRALARFSRFIPFAVAPIVVSGLVLAVVQLGAPGPAWLTAYGYILTAKLGLLVVLFGLAVWNRAQLTGPALAGQLQARYRLRQSIRLELLIVVFVLALAAGWRFTPPPRAIAVADATQALMSQPLYAHAMDDKVMADITLTPGRAGPVVVEILVTDMAGSPFEPIGVDLTFNAPSLGIEPFKASSQLVDGIWRVEDQTIPLAGLWDITLDIRIDRFTLSRIGAEIEVP